MATLAKGESSGYDLAKSFDVWVANFWAATPQQLYRELEKLEAEGLVQARLVHQRRRPDKRVHSLTDAGRTALHEFTARPPKPVAIRDELLVQVEALALGDVAQIRSHLAEKLSASRRKLEHYEQSREQLLDGRPEEQYLARDPRIGPYLTLARGIAFEQETVRWCEFALRVLDARENGHDLRTARPPEPPEGP
ncbi:PadR family transcriptional regulator [Myceligenerans sp. I2]|uniref:PadR family transcriptional regulator n=1 Tax=Myceligenerans indicum TaxID=2593663 RepID=A0ABS1LMB8_9MICO|nr:PadR family transcriptional regulator [Myceligenerans indicum]